MKVKSSEMLSNIPENEFSEIPLWEAEILAVVTNTELAGASIPISWSASIGCLTYLTFVITKQKPERWTLI